MKFSRIYRETKLLWPSSVFIEDGELREGGGGYFPTLNEIWTDVECASENWSEWHQLMVWCIFCGYHKLACEGLVNLVNEVTFNNIDRRYVESRFTESLFSPDTEYRRQMKRAYVNDIKL